MEKNDLSFSNNSDRARATAQINLSHNRDIANNIARIKKRKEEQKRKYVNISSLCDLSTREIDEISPPKTNVLTNYKNSTCMYEVDGIKATIDRSFTNNDFEDNNDTSANMQLCKDCDSVDYFQSEQSIIHSEEDGVIEKEDECYSDLNNEDDSSVESVYGLEQNDREVDDENLSDLEEFENPNIVLKQEPIQFNSDARKRFDAYAFDINSLSEAITKNNDLLYPLAVDDGKKVAKDKLDDITIGEFARMLSEYLITNKITKKGEIDLLKILSSVFGRHYHIPLDVITTKKKVIYSSKISKYNRVNERTVTFDVCSKHQCCVFVGEYAHLRQCYICGSPRYKPCTRGTCKIQKKIGNKDECTHSLLFRKPLLTINYQCILPLICNLSKNDKFRRCLTYEHVKNNAYKYNDVSDGSAFIRNKNEMHDRFKREIEKRREDNRNDMHYEEVSICIAVNYDGVQVCKHKTSTFNPLLMTILSLPPPFRTKYGVGMFLLSLFTLKEKTPAEYFIFNKCLLPELELLGDGYRYQISSNRTAIIQV